MAVGAGKGGVGKSTVALGLALALRRRGSVGVLDLDLYAPDIPAMLGITHRPWTHVLTVARPEATREAPEMRDGLAVVSTGFLLGENQPLGLEGTSLEFLARRLIDGVDWPSLDFLVVDLPAGTSALQHVLARRLRITGALIVVTPQRAAHLDALKVVRLYRHLRVPILGAVVNMADFKCPHCGSVTELFPPVEAGSSIHDAGVAQLARLPFTSDPLAAGQEIFAGLAAHVSARLDER